MSNAAATTVMDVLALLLITAGIITLIWPHNPPLGLAAGGVFLGGISALIAWRRRDG